MTVTLDLTTPLGVVLAEMDAVLEHPVDLLVIGAEARDILAAQLSPDLRLVATTDVDLVLAVDDWGQYEATFAGLTSFGPRGMMFTVAGVRVDIIPFGSVEDPPGTIRPPWMNEPFSVGALRPVFGTASPMTLPDAWRLSCRVPTVAGFAALKLHAWLERSALGETKDAGDFGVALAWFVNHATTMERLALGHSHLLREPEFDLQAAAAQLLGRDIAELLGPKLAAEIHTKWGVDSREHMARLLSSRGLRAATGVGTESQADALLARVVEGLVDGGGVDSDLPRS
jgi:predicted nucleotidyltransferase